jgi:hypothetical protein
MQHRMLEKVTNERNHAQAQADEQRKLVSNLTSALNEGGARAAGPLPCSGPLACLQRAARAPLAPHARMPPLPPPTRAPHLSLDAAAALRPQSARCSRASTTA